MLEDTLTAGRPIRAFLVSPTPGFGERLMRLPPTYKMTVSHQDEQITIQSLLKFLARAVDHQDLGVSILIRMSNNLIWCNLPPP